MSAEARYSLQVRKGFRAVGCCAYQLIETDTPGIADLLITQYRDRFWFIELKVDAPFRVEQRRFLDRTWRRTRNAYLLRFNPRAGTHHLWTGATAAVLIPGAELWHSNKLNVAQILWHVIDVSGYG